MCLFTHIPDDIIRNILTYIDDKNTTHTCRQMYRFNKNLTLCLHHYRKHLNDNKYLKKLLNKDIFQGKTLNLFLDFDYDTGYEIFDDISKISDKSNYFCQLDKVAIRNYKGMVSGCNSVCIKNIKELYLYNCDTIEAVTDMNQLEKLYVYNCLKLSYIVDLKNLREIYLELCSIIYLYSIKSVKKITIIRCNNMLGMYDFPNVELIYMTKCIKLEFIIDMPKLDTIVLRDCSPDINIESCPFDLTRFDYFTEGRQ